MAVIASLPDTARYPAGGGGAVIPVTVPGQQPEIVADQVTAQPQDGPSRARRRPFPVRSLQAVQKLGQPVALDGEQAGIVPGRLGGQHPSILAGR